MAWVAAIGAVASLATSYYDNKKADKRAAQARQSGQNQSGGSFLSYEEPDDARAVYGSKVAVPQFSATNPYVSMDVLGFGKRVSDYNAGEGMANANKMASSANTQATADFDAAMRARFGGDAYYEQRDAVNEVVDDQLQGRLSESTRVELGRRALATGAKNLGRGAVEDAYTGYLGIATEEQVQRGVGNYQSLFSMYGATIPLITGAQMAGFTTLAPAQGVQLEMYNRLNNANFQKEYDFYTHANQVDMAVAAAQPDPMKQGAYRDRMAVDAYNSQMSLNLERVAALRESGKTSLLDSLGGVSGIMDIVGGIYGGSGGGSGGNGNAVLTNNPNNRFGQVVITNKIL